MMDIQPIVAFLKRTYPNPEVDPAWVQECLKALRDAGSEASIDDVHAQYLYSDLSQSTLPSRVFPSGEIHDKILFQRPTLLQIHYLSEIGYSAFQIQTTMEQRSEVLSGQSLIRRMPNEEDFTAEEDQNQVEEGKVPPYQRSMLKFELSDGRQTIKAIEYKRLNGLVLGQTSLGCKLLCQKVRCLRNILLLTPENTQVFESSVEHLEAIQKDQFLNDLKRRMGKADDGAGGTISRPTQRKARLPPPVRPTPQASSSRPVKPARTQVRPASPEIVSTAGPSRSRYFPATSAQNQTSDIPLFDPPSSPALIKPTATRAKGVKATSTRKRSITSVDDIKESSNSTSNQRSSRVAAKAATAKVQQLYHDIPNDRLTELDGEIDEDEFGYDVDESFIRQIDEVEARASKPKTSSAPINRSSILIPQSNHHDCDVDEDGDDFIILDESMMRQIDNIANNNANTRSNSNNSPRKGKQPETIRNKNKKRYDDPDEDTIDYDENGFDVDESFLEYLDEVEFNKQEQAKKSLQSESFKVKSVKQVVDKNSHSSRSSKSGNKARSGRRSPSSPLEDSQKENNFPEVIEISD
ncbi:uncharacterized protein L201_005550 [Kwoniella dendrophila CBS 6074]|uniref:RecQ-mediated genome instability protein 1 n=1 Tax=Kwoniella dendrophila CBS 6074 TaxID=1295534 RepID=A0AAX4JZJ6_9TREE